MIGKDYLGDSVYVEFDGYGIKLTTENGYPDDPRNKIFLEPEVFEALLRYADRVKADIEESRKELAP